MVGSTLQMETQPEFGRSGPGTRPGGARADTKGTHPVGAVTRGPRVPSSHLILCRLLLLLPPIPPSIRVFSNESTLLMRWPKYARPSGVPRGPATSTGSLASQRHAGRDCGQEEKGTTEDEMAGWHHRINPGLISFRMDLLDLLAVQGTLKSLLQHEKPHTSAKARENLRDAPVIGR